MGAVQEQTVSVWKNQISPKVQVAGSGPPVVFLHGAYGLTWDPFLDALAEKHTVYAPEHPGTTLGDPDGIKPLDNLWDLVLYYDELFDQLGLQNPDSDWPFVWWHGRGRNRSELSAPGRQTRAGESNWSVAGR